MKIRFGIREKFTVTVILLVFGAAWVLPKVLFDHARDMVVDHEIGDLRDEAALRCWEIIGQLSKLERLTSEMVGSKAELDRVVERMRNYPKLGFETDPKWWGNIELILSSEESGEMNVLYEAPGAGDLRPPEGLVSKVLERTETQVSELLPFDLPLRARVKEAEKVDSQTPKQRMAGAWAGQKRADAGGAVFVLMSVQRDDSPRHLAFLLSGDGTILYQSRPGDTLEPASGEPNLAKALVRSLRREALPDGPVDEAAEVMRENLADSFREHERSGNGESLWAGAELDEQVQRAPILEKVPLGDHPYYFLEGSASDSFRKALKSDPRKGAEQDDWFLKMQVAEKKLGCHVRGLQEGAKEIRILCKERDKLAEALERTEKALRDRYPKDYSVEWGAQVKCIEADVQMMRFYLHNGTEGGLPYWFAYCAFRDELSAGIGKEMRHMVLYALGMAAGAGGLAFVLGFLMVKPLISITRTAQSVADSSDEALQNRIESLRTLLPGGRRDEAGDIARALDRLLVEVLNGHERLRQANADLEKNVEVRTRDLKEAYEQIKGLAKDKDTFLASVSHELRQPLNSIFGFLQFIEMSELTEQQQKDVGKVRHAATYLKGLIDDILDYQKIIMGGLTLEPETLDMEEFCEHLQASIETLAHERGNKVVFSGASSLGMVVNDRQRLQQVLVNLLTNACKFTENGEVKLDLRRARDKEGEWLVIDVHDTGRGMKPEEMAALFVRFKKLASREGNRSGTGLGLVISKGLSELMGGGITVRSEFGKGSVFTVKVPALVGGAQTLTEESKTITAIRRHPKWIAGISVLVIDDDPVVREMVGRFLRKEGCEVFTAANGEEGIELARKHKPSVITLDVVMPGWNGWETLTRLKSDPVTSEIPVIIATFIEQEGRGYALGAADYLVKPIDWDRLRHVLARHTSAGAKVLVVDDDQSVREIARRTLEKDGWTVLESANGRDALQVVEKELPSLILLDLMMPVMDGFEFMSLLRKDERWKDLPVIVVTAMHLSQEHRDRLSGTVSTILQKAEFTLEQLLEEAMRSVSNPAQPEPHHGKNTPG